MLKVEKAEFGWQEQVAQQGGGGPLLGRALTLFSFPLSSFPTHTVYERLMGGLQIRGALKVDRVEK